MKIYAVIDTNVIFSALISKNQNAATVRLLDAVFDGLVIPLYHSEMIEEYNEVLHRKKFHLSGCRSSNDIEPRKELIVENERRNLSQRRTA